jgi:hypothetical protein
VSDTQGSGTGQHRRVPEIWLYAVDAAESERDIVTTARDFLATWSPVEIARLPEACRPGRITSGEDISEAAYRLSQASLEFDGSVDDRILLERMMGFFLHANARITGLHTAPFF